MITAASEASAGRARPAGVRGGRPGQAVGVYDVDAIALLCREELREQARTLVAEACAWSVGLSDRPHLERRRGVLAPSGSTLGSRAVSGLPLADPVAGRLDLEDAPPGSFADALNALGPDGRLVAEAFDEQVVVPYALDCCLRALRRAGEEQPGALLELLDDLGEDGDDPVAVVRASEWEAPLRTEAEQLVLAALGRVPLVEVEAEGLPLSLVRAAEAETRRWAPVVAEPAPALSEDDLAGSLFLAEAALREAGLPQPVPGPAAADLLDALLEEGLEPEEVLAVLPHLPVTEEAAEEVADRVVRSTGA